MNEIPLLTDELAELEAQIFGIGISMLGRWRETAEAGGDPLPVTGAIGLWTPSKIGWAA